MVALSVMLQQGGLTWPRWEHLITHVEALGFAGVFTPDHFPSAGATMETFARLTYLASRTTRVHFGPLVAPLSFRHPAMLAWQAISLDNLSGGRFVLGLGAGWDEREHAEFGYDLGDIPTRLARFEEGLAVVTRLVRSEGPVAHEGRFFRLQNARLLPKPERANGPPILIGGNGARRTLPLVARYADIWNAPNLTPDSFRDRSARLDSLLREAGRQPRDVRRSVMVWVICGRDLADIDRRGSWMRRWVPQVANQTFDLVLEATKASWAPWFERMSSEFCPIVGTPEAVVDQMNAYAAAGVDELIAQWWDVSDTEGLAFLAEEVLPHLQA